MAVSPQFYAAKTTRIAPLTDLADSFSPDTFARPNFAQGRVVTATFNPAKDPVLEFGPSYSSGQKAQDQEGS